jgi:flagellar hook-basal body complex protein FliE
MAEIHALLQHVAQVQPLDPLGGAGASAKSAGDFRAILNHALTSVENSQRTASQAVENFLNGTGGEVHSTILATQRAELQLQMFLQVRNKVIGAYQEIMRSQV